MTAPARHLIALLAVLAAAGCEINKHCGSDKDCDDSQQACRPEVNRCPGSAALVTLPTGHCRFKSSPCSSDDDCVPLETCSQYGTCGPPAPQCTPVVSCPASCPFLGPFPCACVCTACPPAPDGGV